MCSQVIDRLKMGFMPKNIANLVINITCVLLNLSRALYIFECINLVYKIYFLVSYCRLWFLWPETKKLVIPFVRIYLFASLLSVHCVSPHQRSHKPHRISTLKNQISSFVITSLTTTYRWGWIINSRKIARQCQHWRIQVSLQRKSISGTYLIYHLFARGRATSKHGGGGRYDAILEFKGSE
jgi:hypothetical protein